MACAKLTFSRKLSRQTKQKFLPYGREGSLRRSDRILLFDGRNRRFRFSFVDQVTIKEWRRRESNPRPNLEPEGFLHAYSAICPLARDGHRRPYPHRSLLIFARPSRLRPHYPYLDDTPYERLPKGGAVARDTRLQASLGSRIKPIFLEN